MVSTNNGILIDKRLMGGNRRKVWTLDRIFVFHFGELMFIGLVFPTGHLAREQGINSVVPQHKKRHDELLKGNEAALLHWLLQSSRWG